MNGLAASLEARERVLGRENPRTLANVNNLASLLARKGDNGHDINEELVRPIKADLEQRGHDVLFHRSEIKFGDGWRRSITEGVTGSHEFIFFLSKHSTRDLGVCLDEIGIAIGVKKGNIQTIIV